MKVAFKVLPKLALALGLALSLGFGTKEAAACTTCEQPPPTSCTQYPDPNLFCENLCVNSYDCLLGGECQGALGCVCFER